MLQKLKSLLSFKFSTFFVEIFYHLSFFKICFGLLVTSAIYTSIGCTWTGGHYWGGGGFLCHRPPPPLRDLHPIHNDILWRPLKRVVHILLECILALNLYLSKNIITCVNCSIIAHQSSPNGKLTVWVVCIMFYSETSIYQLIYSPLV